MDKLLIGILVVVGLYIFSGSNTTAPVRTPVLPGTTLNPEPVVTNTPKDSAVQTPSREYVQQTAEEGDMTINNVGQGTVNISEGETTRIFSFSVQAKGSDISVQRVKVDLGADRNLWLRIIKTLYVIDENGNILAQTELTRNSVVNIEGFNYAVQKNATKTLHVRILAHNLIDSSSFGTYTVSLPENGVRAQDERGANIYGPDKTFSVVIKPL